MNEKPGANIPMGSFLFACGVSLLMWCGIGLFVRSFING